MSDQSGLNERGNHQGEFTQGVGGWAEYTVYLTPTSDAVRHDVKLPPRKIIPVIFLPGVMGSNLRLSKQRQKIWNGRTTVRGVRTICPAMSIRPVFS